MNTRRNHIQLLPTYIGTAVSFLTYLVLGAVPGILYGGYMGLVMSTALFGNAAEPSILARIVTGGGMALGLFASLFFFLVIGAFVGAAIAGLVALGHLFQTPGGNVMVPVGTIPVPVLTDKESKS